MAKYELFSKRQKRERGEVPDVYVYDRIPQELRVQAIHIWGDTIGHTDPRGGSTSGEVYRAIHDSLCREWGCFTLGDDPHSFHENRLRMYLGTCSAEHALDIIELSFRFINGLLRDSNQRYSLGSTMSADDAIEELNERFRWHGVGYQFESGYLIRVDSQFLHAEAVKPVLQLLSEKHYAGANAEFLNAFEHYRHGKTKECLTECLKAFESTMKAICAKRGWAHNSTDTAKLLIDVCVREGLIPAMLRANLESGIPTVRNRLSGHGQGAAVVNVPPHYASYMLHLAATTIKFLAEAEKDLP
jgi:AbiJ N-terminal domain 4